MAGRTKSEIIDIEKCKEFARELFGLQQTPFYMLQYKYALQSAKLARNIFESRNDIEYFAAVSCEKRYHEADVVEAAGILSNTTQYGWTNYDDIADLTSTEVADYLQYVNINKNEPLFRSTANMLSQLCICNSIKLYGPIFIVLARALVIAESVGASPNASMLGNNSASYATQLWSAYHTVKELKRANVYNWSRYTYELIEEVDPILESWKQNALITTINFKGTVNWRLDTSLEFSDNHYIDFVEV